MLRTEKILICDSLESLPTLTEIKTIPRGGELKIIFSGAIESQRKEIGEQWRNDLPDFQVGIHLANNEINISKLITEEEIVQHQKFFELCARDYAKLSEQLIRGLAAQLKIEIGSNGLQGRPAERNGKYLEWRYNFHGAHCGFEHLTTGQCIETPLTWGLEFGELDPYFFSKFIMSTSAYQPLPVIIYEDYADGKRILEKMVELGRFERIGDASRKGVVVKKY